MAKHSSKLRALARKTDDWKIIEAYATFEDHNAAEVRAPPVQLFPPEKIYTGVLRTFSTRACMDG